MFSRLRMAPTSSRAAGDLGSGSTSPRSGHLIESAMSEGRAGRVIAANVPPRLDEDLLDDIFSVCLI